MRFLIFLTLILSGELFAFQSSVIDPVYDRLDSMAIDKLVEKYLVSPAQTVDEKKEWILSLYFKSERARFDQKPHLELEFLEKATRPCDLARMQVDDSLSLACTLVYSRRAHEATGFEKLKYFQTAIQTFEKAQKSSSDRAEMYYVEGRLLLNLAEPLEPRLGKSILAFQILLRMRPDLSQSTFWITEAYSLNGSKNGYEENLALALKEKNIRTLLTFSKGTRASRRYLEGSHFGNRLGLFANSIDGLGVAYAVWDDKLWDHERNARISVFATTQKSFGGKIHYEDGALIAPYTLRFGTSIDQMLAEFYGVGIDTTSSERSQYKRQALSSHFELSHPLLDSLTFSLGWEIYQRHLTSLEGGPHANLSELYGENIFFSGGYFGLSYDTLLSEDYSREGMRLRFKASFPTEKFLSSYTFQKWNADGEIHTNVSGVLLKAKVASQLTSGNTPFDGLVSVEALELSGVRKQRYRDTHLSGASLEAKRAVYGPFVLGAYATSVLPALDFAKAKVGGGGLLEVFLTSYRKRQARLEVGALGNEFVFNLDLGMSL